MLDVCAAVAVVPLQAKALPMNERATMVTMECGCPTQVLGDTLIARNFDGQLKQPQQLEKLAYECLCLCRWSLCPFSCFTRRLLIPCSGSCACVVAACCAYG